MGNSQASEGRATGSAENRTDPKGPREPQGLWPGWGSEAADQILRFTEASALVLVECDLGSTASAGPTREAERNAVLGAAPALLN